MTFVTLMLQGRWPWASLTMIGKLLGHTQVQTTARYAHLVRDSIQNAAARIAGSIGGNLLSGQDADKHTGRWP